MKINKILLFFLLNSAVFFGTVFAIINLSILDWKGFAIAIVCFVSMTVCYQHFLNLVHQASHQAISKKKWINNSIGFFSATISGFTLADFKATHLQHHANLGNSQKDPDEQIVHTKPLLLMAFSIWKHDAFFWKHGLWKRRQAGVSYIITRLIQVTLLALIVANGLLNSWLVFSMAPLLIIGTLNGFFLFYFPHYKPEWERKIRTEKTPALWKKWIMLSIDISRIYHELHHDDVHNKLVYFPFLHILIDLKNNSWKTKLQEHGKKYILSEGN